MRFQQSLLVDLEKTLQNEYSPAKIGAGTVENESSKVWYFDTLAPAQIKSQVQGQMRTLLLDFDYNTSAPPFAVTNSRYLRNYYFTNLVVV